MHEKNWSISFESDDYENDVELLIEDAIDAVRQTAQGCYVNVVTPANLGHPHKFLTDALHSHFENAIETKFIDQCGCGGYVLRVWKRHELKIADR